MASRSFITRGCGESGGKCIWLLNVLDDNRSTLAIEYYDLQHHHVLQTNTCYRFSVFCVISPQHKMPFFSMLFETFGEAIHMIVDSNLRLECYPHTLLDCLFQVNHSERLIQYDLCSIECVSSIACRRIHDFLKHNLKPYYECVNSLETSYMLMMHLFLETNTIQYEHQLVNDATKSISLRLKYLKSKISPRLYHSNSKKDMKKAFSFFDPARVFVTNGLYIFNLDTLRLTLFSSETADLYKLLPMIAFDIETIADNMIDVPTGCSANEKIVSYVLIATHMERAIICVNYLRFLSLDQQEIMDSGNDAVGTTKWWQERDEHLSQKYQRQFLHNYDELHVLVESYDDEIQLLESFIQLYSSGQLLRALVLNAKAKHFFTGHNIIKYDMPVMLRRFKWHQMHQLVEDHVVYDTSSLGSVGSEDQSVIVKFHKNAYLIDSYRIFQQQHLAYNLSLKSLTTTYLSRDHAKIELNPVEIRIYYILGTMLQQHQKDGIQFLQQVANDAMKIYPPSSQPPSPVVISLKQLPRSIHSCLTNGNLNIDELQVYDFDQFLAYNVMDCESVLGLWKKFNYRLLFSLITQMYPCNLEKALQANATTRTKIAFDYYAIKYRQILSARDFKTLGTNKQLRYLFHRRLNESLLYKSTQVLQVHEQDDNGSTDYIESNYEITNQDECSEIDESKCRKNVDQFFVQLYNQNPIVDLVSYKSTKKKYAGAAVIVQPGLYANCIQMDVISQYPNILVGKHLFTDSVDSCSAGSLQKILTTDSTCRENFSSWLRTDCIQIYIAEDGCKVNFTTYLKNFLFHHSEDGGDIQVVGQLIMSIEILMKLPTETPLLIYCPDSQAFLNNFICHLLDIRKDLQHEIDILRQSGANSENVNVLDAKQKFIKVTVNSIYGLFGNTCIPVAAMTTLFGRKILIFASKFLPIVVLQVLMQHLKICHWLLSKHQLDLLNDLADCNDVLLSSLYDKFNPRLVDSLTTENGRRQFRKTCHLLLAHFSIASLESICEMTTTNETQSRHEVFNDKNIALLHVRCLMDGQTSVRELTKTSKQLQQMLIDDARCSDSDYIQNIFNALPSVVKNCVFDCDTDGLHFVNTFELDSKLLLQLLNEEMVQVFQMDNIIFDDKQSAYIFSLAKKKCTTFKFDPLCNVKFLNEQCVIYIDDCSVRHNGYERNALPCLKYLSNFVAVLCLLIHQSKTLRRYKFREIIWSVFNYLQKLPPGQLYIQVKLNRLKVNSARRRFIDKYTQTYNGSLRAVYVVTTSPLLDKPSSSVELPLSTSSKHLEQLVMLDDYVCNVKHERNNANNQKMQLHHGFFLRTFGKIWFQQYCLATTVTTNDNDDTLQLKNKSIMSIINQFFGDWLSRSEESRRVDDLDHFLLSRFVIINKPS